MIINLEPGDIVKIRLDGTDGEFRIHFDSETYPNKLVVEETGGYNGDIGKANSVLYMEKFSDCDSE